MAIALAKGLAVEGLERSNKAKPNSHRNATNYLMTSTFGGTPGQDVKVRRYYFVFSRDVARRCVPASRIMLRWLFFGVVLALLN